MIGVFLNVSKVISEIFSEFEGIFVARKWFMMDSVRLCSEVNTLQHNISIDCIVAI